MKKLAIFISIVFYLTSCNKEDIGNKNNITIKKEMNSVLRAGHTKNKMLLAKDNNILILGYNVSTEKTVLYKTDISGNIIWQKNLTDTSHIRGERIKQINDGNFILVGSKSLEIEDWTSGKAYISKLNDKGDILWENEFYPSHYNTVYDVQELNNGDLLMLCGHEITTNSIIEQAYILKVNSQGDSIYSKFFDFELKALNLEKKTNDFTFIIDRLPIEDGGALYNRDNILYEIDENGNEIFAKSFSDDLNIQPIGHIVLKENDLFVYGSYEFDNNSGNQDIFISRLSSNGDTIWSKTKNYLEQDKMIDFIPTIDGGYIAAGTSEDNSHIIRQYIYVMKLNSNGDILWKKDYDIGQEPEVSSIIEVSLGKYRILCSNIIDKMLFIGIE